MRAAGKRCGIRDAAASNLKRRIAADLIEFFDRDFTELYGDWREWQGMRASNLYFLPLRSDSPSSHSQPLLKLSATCGNPDIRNRRK